MIHDLKRINSDFNYTDKLRDFSINLAVKDYQDLWEMVSGSSNVVGAVLYERIANYVRNIRDIELCGLKQLYSLAKEMDVEQAFSYDINYPVDLSNLMDILSVDRSHLLTSGYILNNSTLTGIYADLDLSEALTSIMPERFCGYGKGSSAGSGNTVWIETTGMFLVPGSDGYLVNTRKNIFTDAEVSHLSSNVFISDQNFLTGFLEYTLSAFLQEKLSHQSNNYGYLAELTGLSPSADYVRHLYIEAIGYQDFLINIYSNPAVSWNSSISGDIVTESVHTLRNIAIRASYQRETLKQIAKKYAMIGSSSAIEKIFEEYILRSFTKRSDWRLYVESDPAKLVTPELSAAFKMESVLPSLSSVNSYFDVKLIEYWDTTEYMNVSAFPAPHIAILGYNDTQVLTSQVDASGNYIEGYITSAIPYYGQSGWEVSGGNPRYWESDYITDSILDSETTSAEVSGFYYRMGLTGGLNEVFGFSQTTKSLDDPTLVTVYTGILSNLWNTYCVSGYNRYAVIPDLTGTLNPEWIGVTGSLPSSAWLVAPTHLSGIHFKYIGNISGDAVSNNYKNTIYPTIATQPVIWNLVEKAFDEFPSVVRTVLLTEQGESEISGNMVNSIGTLIDSWRYYNHEYIGYQTYFEESSNSDFSGGMNPAIDRDGPFDPNALSAYITMELPDFSLTAEMMPYYAQISESFAFSAIHSFPCIDYQLSAFYTNILELNGMSIYQYSFDHYDNHYALYKTSDSFEELGRVWMRYRNHPLSFPLCVSPSGNSAVESISGIISGMYERMPGLESSVATRQGLQQMYCRIDELEQIFDGKCNDFGFYSNIVWAVGEAVSGFGALYVFSPDFVAFDQPISSRRFTMRVDQQTTILKKQFAKPNYFVGNYLASDDTVFVTFNGWKSNEDGWVASFNFYWYDIYNYKFVERPTSQITLSGLPEPLFLEGEEQQWKLRASEEILTLCYESVNPNFSESNPLINNIVTVMTDKYAPSDRIGEYRTMIFNNFVGGSV